MTKQNEGYFLSQPHQPFFTLGVINAIVFMLLFALSYNGLVLSTIDITFFHSYGFIFLVFTPFFMGFLLTTYPRFSQTQVADKRLYTKLFHALIVATVALVLTLYFPLFIYASYLLVLIVQLLVLWEFTARYKASPLHDKFDIFWISVGWSMGIVTNIAFIAGVDIAPYIGVYLYLCFTAFSIAQRMVPFFSHVMIEKDRNLLKMVFVLFVLMIAVKFLNLKTEGLFSIIAGVLVLKEIFRWKLPTKGSPPILWILHLALYWLPVALIAGGISMLVEVLFHKELLALSIHLVVLGFLTTILIGFGTRVTLGHSGNMMEIDRFTKVLFYLTQLLIYFRVIFSLSNSMIIFNITAFVWVLLFVGWSYKYMKVLIFGKQLTRQR